MFSQYQQIMRALRASTETTHGRIRCWVLHRESGEASITALSMVGSQVEATVIWRGAVAPAEADFVLDYFNVESGAGRALIEAMKNKYTSHAGPTFLRKVDPHAVSAAIH